MFRMPIFRLLPAYAVLACLALGAPARAQDTRDAPDARQFQDRCQGVGGSRGRRVVCADVVALDQMLVYNRFGSFNPFGMILALRRDVVPMEDDGDPARTDCSGDTATAPAQGTLSPGSVRLRDCHRPRPLVLRANVGDLLYIHVRNLLAPEVAAGPPATELSRDFCGLSDDRGLKPTDDRNRAEVAPHVGRGTEAQREAGEVLCKTGPRDAASTVLAEADWPRTRGLNLVIEGLMPLALADGGAPHGACLGLDAVKPGDDFTCLYEVVQEGTHFMASRAAPAGGEGDGGSITHGLFGAVMAERPGTRWYRSQVSPAALDLAWTRGDATGKPRHTRLGTLDYEARKGTVPVLAMARALPLDAGGDASAFWQARAVEIVHGDLNAIVYCDAAAPAYSPALSCQTEPDDSLTTTEPTYAAFREFSVFFHDELKSFYTRNFQELARFGQLAGVRDGFAINYGASGMGTMLLANRKGIGPAANCMECLYEEFFLTSWANGDPALLEWYADDPSNVHHSYLNDPVVFRNFHAGPKETHVFHLHAHQWFAGNDPGRGSYLDSQTVAPGQGFTYNIYHGGRRDGQGKWYVGGSGNRNRTVGDSIFHCHLYPHFAQGMWALWRVHDVLEDGTRKLPDGQAEPGISAEIRSTTDLTRHRPGSVDPDSGAWIRGGTGTPIPALVPLPGDPLPPLPTYNGERDAKAQPPRTLENAPRRGAARGAAGSAAGGPERVLRVQAAPPPPPAALEPVTAGKAAPDAAPETAPETAPAASMPGYPFYIAGQPGHRPPQAAKDIARAPDPRLLGDPDRGGLLSGGLGRHVVLSSGRKPGIALSPQVEAMDRDLQARLADDPLAQTDRAARRDLERLRSRIVAKALAMGDMTAHLTDTTIQPLDPEGTALERAAQQFHAAERGPALFTALGEAVVPARGGYETPLAPRPGAAVSAARGIFLVNGAPPAPGAPFADPCGGVRDRDGPVMGTDPLTGRDNYVIDPALTAFRRYEVSAVQLDLVVNQAGWHDPQARIDVLTASSWQFKDGGTPPLPHDATPSDADREAAARAGDATRGRISPTVRDDQEPFFFRAFSGECIEFRHTNELPKELDLDDFQVRTPTDTLGQHIHLVKFDVTASDGSGNGWNYEDGTFAPDELMARRCAARETLAGNPAWGFADPPDAALCAAIEQGSTPLAQIWRLPLHGQTQTPGGTWLDNRTLFQTTVQRWFADPMLTRTDGDDHDRTMRTVFSHDHFGPSSVQQHGFYTALLVEPNEAPDPGGANKGTQVCDGRSDDCLVAPTSAQRFVLQHGEPLLVGGHKRLLFPATTQIPADPDYREFALAIADFALLYSPRDREDEDEALTGTGRAREGMDHLHCEMALAATGRRAEIAAICGEPDPAEPEADASPAAWAALSDGLLSTADTRGLRDHLLAYRGRAASPDGVALEKRLARPVAAPSRPESISVDHHDPYLVNYRHAPLPLRLASDDGRPSDDCRPRGMRFAGLTEGPGTARADSGSDIVSDLLAGALPRCSYGVQLAGLAGDVGRALSSWDASGRPTRDPETPQLEAYAGERLMLRLVQGAQEVQHVFNVAGLAGPRNMDQRFSQGMRALAVSAPPARAACFDKMRQGFPTRYDRWLDNPAGATDPAFKGFESLLAGCDNPEGYTFGQEVGISEHFEFRSRLRSDISSTESLQPPQTVLMAERVGVDDAPSPETGHGGMSDYLWNFGTLDAFWNGAWGLIRVYADPSGRAAALPGTDRPLVPVNRKTAPETEAGTGRKLEIAPPPKTDPDRPLREYLASMGGTCPLHPGSMQRAALVVALRTADVWPRGTDYGGHRRDPGGMMLALLAPDALGGQRDFLRDDDWRQPLRREDLTAAVLRAYARPEPFVLRVHAGDCVVLRFVNALSEADLRPALGDALAPRITPLSLDPIPAAGRTRTAGMTEVRGELQPTTRPVEGLRPSARVGLSVGLPGGDLIRNLPLGYGVNAVGMEPGMTVSKVFRFYAGRTRVVFTTSIDDDIDDAVKAWNLGGTIPTLRQTGPGDHHFRVLGRRYAVCETSENCAPFDADTKLRMQAQASARLQKHIHFIPYAYGPVPVRVTGDVITQTVHGLFGVIDVLPQGWPIDDAIGPAMTQPALDRQAQAAMGGGPYHGGWRTGAVPRDFGAPAVFPTARLDPGSDATTRLREFVIFFQDGLNHRDDRSRIRWSWKPGTGTGPIPALTPDCPICDDSYDRGEQGVSYRSRPFASLLRFGDIDGNGRIEASDDLNAVTFPPRFLAGQKTLSGNRTTEEMLTGDMAPLTLRACTGEQVVIRVVHPGGRARQRSFVMNGLGYDDLFPGFGFPNSALVAPGKSVSAWLHPPQVLGPDGARVPVRGRVLWHDGVSMMMAGGTWGHVDFEDCPRGP
ncbi:hypothetical protein [Paracoccus yeei]|uniref:hypothetical protein n=2 Tax=Paracoccus yeei TaxID=147645 RepID=UPI00048ADF07|nr:hypothetical protein [Paracoccus yeei]OWJ90265.1 hypothetical protein CDV54_16535 [Paracoccus yeei]